MENKIKLKEALKIVSTALENGTIDYDWLQISHCNCGLVAQAITGTNKNSLEEIYLNKISEDLQLKKKTEFTPNWTDMTAEYCPLTGEPLANIFKTLYEAGMKREDFAHLEYLNDPKILAASKIDTNDTYTKTYTEKETRVTGWWLFKERKVVSVEKEKNIEYYAVKENLIAYLKAWIVILNTETPAKTISVDGEEFKYRNSIQLENLKKHFLKLENYTGVTLVQKELDKYKK